MENKNTYFFDELPVDAQEKALKRMFASPYYEGMVESGVDDACQDFVEKLCPNSGRLIDWDFDFYGKFDAPSSEVIINDFSLRAETPEQVRDLLKDVFVEERLNSLPDHICKSIVLFCSFDNLARVNIDSEESYNLVAGVAEEMRQWFSAMYWQIKSTVKTTIESYHSLDYVRDHVIGAGIEFYSDGYDIGGRMERD